MKGSNYLYIALLLVGLCFLHSLWPSDEWIEEHKGHLIGVTCLTVGVWWTFGATFMNDITGETFTDLWMVPNNSFVKYILFPPLVPWTIGLIIIRVFNKYFSTGAAKEHYKHIKILS